MCTIAVYVVFFFYSNRKAVSLVDILQKCNKYVKGFLEGVPRYECRQQKHDSSTVVTYFTSDLPLIFIDAGKTFRILADFEISFNLCMAHLIFL